MPAQGWPALVGGARSALSGDGLSVFLVDISINSIDNRRDLVVSLPFLRVENLLFTREPLNTGSQYAKEAIA